jgi:hypothetical protein
MLCRTTSLLLLFLAGSVSGQQANVNPQMNQRMMAHDHSIRPEPIPEADRQAYRQQAILRDVQQLTTLNASLDEQLRELQKGMLSKDLAENLKQVEKLSKRLRQEVTQR